MFGVSKFFSLTVTAETDAQIAQALDVLSRDLKWFALAGMSVSLSQGEVEEDAEPEMDDDATTDLVIEALRSVGYDNPNVNIIFRTLDNAGIDLVKRT